jgi:Tol biopolymer transport system component
MGSTKRINAQSTRGVTVRWLIGAAIALLLAGFVLVPTASATLPGRNGLIAFSADRGSGSQIYTVDERGRHLRRLTHMVGNAIAPHWSPNARQIVFEFDHSKDGGCSVMLMNSDGSNLVELTRPDPNVCNANPTFTPDGSRIFFDRGIGLASCNDQGCTITDQAIWTMNVRGGAQHRITRAAGFAFAPEVSPDSTMLAFDSAPEGLGNALWVSRIDGSHRRRLTPYSFDVQFKHEWSPDGTHLVFTAHDPGTHGSLNVGTIAIDGSDLTFLTSYVDPDTGFGGSYSPDGRWIAYRVEEAGQFALLAMSPDGSTQEQILPFSPLRPRYITWANARR